MTYLPIFVDDTAPTNVLGSSGTPTTFSTAYTLSSEVDLYGYSSVTFFVFISNKSTAAKLYCTFQEGPTSGGTFGWVQAEGSPAAAAPDMGTDTGRYKVSVNDIDNAAYVVTFNVPVVHRSRGGRFCKIGIAFDAGTPEGWVQAMRKGA